MTALRKNDFSSENGRPGYIYNGDKLLLIKNQILESQTEKPI